MNLTRLYREFPTDERCRELLKRLRWPDGPKCPRCSGVVGDRPASVRLLHCPICNYPFSVTAGTIFADSHLPLITWFAATFLTCEARKGMSANQIKRTLGVSYKTAWYLCHRIRAAMATAERLPLTGTGIVGSWHKVSAKHLSRYLAEMEFRFNRRKSPRLWIETLRHMVTTEPLRFAALISESSK